MRAAVGVALLALGACRSSSSAQEQPPPASSEVRYLALGDSFTAGTGNAPAEAFPARLAERWRAKGKQVTLKNVAVNGYTTDDLTVRELPEVAPFRPTFVTLAIRSGASRSSSLSSGGFLLQRWLVPNELSIDCG